MKIHSMRALCLSSTAVVSCELSNDALYSILTKKPVLRNTAPCPIKQSELAGVYCFIQQVPLAALYGSRTLSFICTLVVLLN